MVSRSNRRLIFLFVAAVLLPCGVLILMSLRSLRQERELVVKRQQENRATAQTRARAALREKLEAIEAEQLARPGLQRMQPPVRLVAEIDGSRLILPWQRGGFSSAAPDAEAAAQLRRGHSAEFSARDYAAAAEILRNAASGARNAAVAGVARLSLARVLGKTGQKAEQQIEFQRLLALPLEIRDQQGIPFAFYAASQLAGDHPDAIFSRFRNVAVDECCYAAEALYMLRAALDSARGRGVSDSALNNIDERTSRAIQTTEQALALQADFASLGLRIPNAGQRVLSRWILYGNKPWFVSVGLRQSSTAREPVLVAIDANEVLSHLKSGSSGAWLALPASQESPRLLAADLSDIPVEMTTAGTLAEIKPRFPGSFPVAVLIFVIGATLFSAFLLWFDVQRELRLAEVRSQFVSSVSHELKTPLTAIRMFAETMLLERAPNPEQDREYLATIVNESERLTRLLNNVLDLARIERGQKSYQFTPVSLEDVLNRCLRTLEYPLAQQGFRLNVRIDPNVPRLDADEDALQQAVLNLLTNAMKYSGDSRDIDLALRRQNAEAVIEVSDHGVGIPQAYIGRVAEKFYRVPTPENARIPGTGLGLTLVDHIARAHGGKLVIESEAGRGSRLGIHLPYNSGHA